MSLLTEISSTRVQPKYVSLAQQLLKDMSARNLKPGDRLSTEHEMASEYNLSRVTVRQALRLLEEEGIVSRKRAQGTFVEREIQLNNHIGVIHGTVVIVCSNEDVHCEDDFAFSRVVRTMEQSLATHGYNAQILSIGKHAPTDRGRLAALQQQDGLKGILTIGPCLEPYREIVPLLPVVITCTFNPNGQPWVGQDAKVATEVLMAHLLERGHRDIAMICGSWIDSQALARFVKGYRDAFEAAGLTADRSMIFHAYADESLVELAKEVLNGRVKPTAIFCEDWRVCQAVLQAAQDLKLRIPEDLSVIGFGQNVTKISSPVQITAYVSNSAKVAEASVDLLAKIIESDETPEDLHVLVPGDFVEGESVRSL